MYKVKSLSGEKKKANSSPTYEGRKKRKKSSTDSDPGPVTPQPRKMSRPPTRNEDDLVKALRSFGLDTISSKMDDVKRDIDEVKSSVKEQSRKIDNLENKVVEQGNTMNNIQQRLTAIELATADNRSEIANVKKQLLNNDIIAMTRIEELTQRERNKAIKIVGFKCDQKLEPEQLAPLIFDKLLKHIICKFENDVLPWSQYLNMVHFNRGNSPKTIYVSFMNRIIRNGVLRHKKKTLEELGSTFEDVRIFADVSAINLSAVRRIRSHAHVTSAWYASNHFCYKTGDNTIHRIFNIDHPLITSGRDPQLDGKQGGSGGVGGGAAGGGGGGATGAGDPGPAGAGAGVVAGHDSDKRGNNQDAQHLLYLISNTGNGQEPEVMQT